jgi:hypothetical protein
MADKLISCCGLVCSDCGAFKATAADDDAMRAKVSEEWSKSYSVQIPPESINCTGCTSDGVKFQYAENKCEIRKCAVGRNLHTCAECGDYACDKLGEFFKTVPAAKENLDALRPKKP